MKKSIFFVVLISFFINLSPLFSETAEPYTKEEFPGVLNDLRRAEIITLGAMPFITFSTTLGYSFGKYAFHDFDSDYFVNPFSSTDENSFSTDEQIGIILTSLGISAGIGITDFIVHSIKRSNKMKRLRKQTNNNVIITPIKEDPNAVKIEEPIKEKPSEDLKPSVDTNANEINEQSETITNNEKHIKTARELNVISED